MISVKNALAVAIVVGGLLVAAGGAAAQDEIMAAGNGGTATAAANGGAAAVGDVDSGDNAGNAITVGDTWGDVDVTGGSSANATDLSVDALGGTAISDASGGAGEPD